MGAKLFSFTREGSKGKPRPPFETLSVHKCLLFYYTCKCPIPQNFSWVKGRVGTWKVLAPKSKYIDKLSCLVLSCVQGTTGWLCCMRKHYLWCTAQWTKHVVIEHHITRKTVVKHIHESNKKDITVDVHCWKTSQLTCIVCVDKKYALQKLIRKRKSVNAVLVYTYPP